jgi:hypothetical protein
VSRAPYKFWTIIVLLIVRLALGESAHAMPHAPDTSVSGAAVECPDHQSDPSGSERPAAEPECCQLGSCECPCFHAPCAMQIGARPVALIAIEVRCILDTTLVGLDQSSDLLRPPA